MTTVAGTTNAITAENTPLRYTPMYNTLARLSDAPPKYDIITRIVAMVKNSFVSFPVTLRKPTINPASTNNDVSQTTLAPSAGENNPSTIARITPTINE